MRRTYDSAPQVTLASGINALLGIWLIAAPFVLDYTGYTDSMWNAIIVGAIVLSIAAIRFLGAFEMSWLSWFNAALGVWLIVAPFVFGNGDVSQIVWNHVLVGIAIVVFGVWSALASPGGPMSTSSRF